MKIKSPHVISLVIPAYKQEKTILKDIKNLKKSLDDLHQGYEIIIVIDGVLDKTYQQIKKFKSNKIKVYKFEKNQGKGSAIKFGVSQAKGDIIGFIDAGMDIDPTGIAMLINHMLWYNADIVVGSKLHPVSQVNYPAERKILSWGYRTFTRILFGFKIRDTQAGIKFYRRKVARDVFPRLLVKKFAFDVEILALSYALGYTRIYEAPIKLKFRGANSITSTGLWKIILLMLWDTMAIFYRVRIIKFYKRSNKKNWAKENATSSKTKKTGRKKLAKKKTLPVSKTEVFPRKKLNGRKNSKKNWAKLN